MRMGSESTEYIVSLVSIRSCRLLSLLSSGGNAPACASPCQGPEKNVMEMSFSERSARNASSNSGDSSSSPEEAVAERDFCTFWLA